MPLIALGIGCQGVYLLTSIGLNLTGRTEYYPVSTMVAAGVGLGSGVILMPLYGTVGAGVAFLLAYVTLAAVAGVFARRHYPVPYERGRLARVVAAAATAAAVAWLIPALPPVLGILARGSVTVAVFLALLAAGGFFRPTERAFLTALLTRVRRRRAVE